MEMTDVATREGGGGGDTKRMQKQLAKDITKQKRRLSSPPTSLALQLSILLIIGTVLFLVVIALVSYSYNRVHHMLGQVQTFDLQFQQTVAKNEGLLVTIADKLRQLIASQLLSGVVNVLGGIINTNYKLGCDILQSHDVPPFFCNGMPVCADADGYPIDATTCATSALPFCP
jgi:cell division protein FtsL